MSARVRSTNSFEKDSPNAAIMRAHTNGLSKSGKSRRGSEQPALFLVFLIGGIFFCLIDCFYIFNYILGDRHQAEAPCIEHIVMQPQATTTRQEKSGASILTPPVAKKATTLTEDEDTSTASNVTDEQVNAILNDPDRQHLVELLRDADLLKDLDRDKILQLPKWSAVTDLYGKEPILIGLETCKKFQEQNKVPKYDHFVSTAGTFNTGTNLMAELLIHNCRMPERMKKYGNKQRGVRWQVLWGKHTPVGNETFRQGHRTYNDSALEADAIFPAVMVRDPLKWMQSMCRHEYGAHWPHGKAHCPNLVPTVNDYPLMRSMHWNVSKVGSVPVDVHYAEFHVVHDSLVGFWNNWYTEYAEVQWPRLLVRFEDLIFFPKQVTKTVCECAGGELNPIRPFIFVTDSAKRGTGQHGKKSERTTYIDALIKYGTEKGRYDGYESADLQFAREHLDPKLMELFQYRLPPEPKADDAKANMEENEEIEDEEEQ